jgi:hypothetical protein
VVSFTRGSVALPFAKVYVSTSAPPNFTARQLWHNSFAPDDEIPMGATMW